MNHSDTAWRVLVVEDSKTQARMYQHTLQSEEYVVEVAYSAEQAREMMRDKKFDCVISDIVMPGDSGYDLCRDIKSNPATSAIPVVLITSLGDVHDIVEGLECGADNFFTKPVDPVALLERLGNLRVTQAMVNQGRLKSGFEVFIMGRKVALHQDRQQIFNLLLSTCEDIVRKNQELSELRQIRAQLEEYAKRLQTRLTYHVGKYRMLFEQFYDGMAFLDASGKVEEVNDAACHLWESRPMQMIGKNIDELLTLDEPFESLVDKALEQRLTLRLNGRNVEVEVKFSRLEFESREIIGMAVRRM